VGGSLPGVHSSHARPRRSNCSRVARSRQYAARKSPASACSMSESDELLLLRRIGRVRSLHVRPHCAAGAAPQARRNGREAFGLQRPKAACRVYQGCSSPHVECASHSEAMMKRRTCNQQIAMRARIRSTNTGKCRRTGQELWCRTGWRPPGKARAWRSFCTTTHHLRCAAALPSHPHLEAPRTTDTQCIV
jgi:hypothetical protein